MKVWQSFATRAMGGKSRRCGRSQRLVTGASRILPGTKMWCATYMKQSYLVSAKWLQGLALTTQKTWTRRSRNVLTF